MQSADSLSGRTERLLPFFDPCNTRGNVHAGAALQSQGGHATDEWDGAGRFEPDEKKKQFLLDKSAGSP